MTTTITNEMVEAVYEAVRDGASPVEIIAAVAPLIAAQARAQAIEEAAKVAESEAVDHLSSSYAYRIADRIRAISFPSEPVESAALAPATKGDRHDADL